MNDFLKENQCVFENECVDKNDFFDQVGLGIWNCDKVHDSFTAKFQDEDKTNCKLELHIVLMATEISTDIFARYDIEHDSMKSLV